MSHDLQEDGLLIVVHDDIDFSLGKIKLKHRGGDAGHRGVGSMLACVGTGEFSRVRMDVGRPACKTLDVVDDVLAPCTAEETDRYEAMITQALDTSRRS